MRLIFATNNQHKIDEIKAVLNNRFSIITLKDAGIDIDIPEPHHTIEENAAEKASVIYKLTGENSFSEDTGLEVFALNGEPGVNSARYAGEPKNDKNNIEKLLHHLKSETNRQAQFKTIICLIINGKQHMFEGICKGQILLQKKGSKGFGYDPVFKPDGADKSFAEMDMNEKNKYSHRRKATDKLVAFLNNLDEKS